MILNKGSKERGFAHAQVIATKLIDLSEIRGEKGLHYYFGALQVSTFLNVSACCVAIVLSFFESQSSSLLCRLPNGADGLLERRMDREATARR